MAGMRPPAPASRRPALRRDPAPGSDLLITSPTNGRVKELVALRRRRVRDAERVMLVEGLEESALAVDAGAQVRTLFYCPELMLEASAATATDLVDRVRDSGAETIRLS